MYNLQYDIELAFSILNEKKECSDDFKIYPWSNEHIEKYYNYYNLTNKKALCITGSGDHAIHAAAAGACEIDCIDINPLAKYYQMLKVALILTYDEKTFFKHFKNSRKKILTEKINLNDIKEYIDDEAFIFWNEIINSKTFKKNKRLFRNDGFPNKFLLDYEALKEKLITAKIKYYDNNIEDFIYCKDNQYDAIFLSNVLEWQCKTRRNPILINALNLLNENGVIYDACIKRDLKNEIPISGFEKKLATKKSDIGVLIYRKK